MASAVADLSVKQQVYGKHPSGATVTLWTLNNAAPGGIQVQAIDYGQQSSDSPASWQFVSFCLGSTASPDLPLSLAGLSDL